MQYAEKARAKKIATKRTLKPSFIGLVVNSTCISCHLWKFGIKLKLLLGKMTQETFDGLNKTQVYTPNYNWKSRAN